MKSLQMLLLFLYYSVLLIGVEASAHVHSNAKSQKKNIISMDFLPHDYPNKIIRMLKGGGGGGGTLYT